MYGEVETISIHEPSRKGDWGAALRLTKAQFRLPDTSEAASGLRKDSTARSRQLLVVDADPESMLRGN